MNSKNSGSTAAWRPRPSRRQIEPYLDSTTDSCELHGRRIGDALPAGCPLLSGGRAAVHRLYDRAWRLIANPDLQAFPGQGQELLERFEICFCCEAHRSARVQYLLRVDQARQPVQVGETLREPAADRTEKPNPGGDPALGLNNGTPHAVHRIRPDRMAVATVTEGTVRRAR